ncbi:hypothetical protein [Herbidospora sp. RD11066]
MTTPAQAKTNAMASINEGLLLTPLAKAKVWNASKSITEESAPPFAGGSGVSGVPEFVADKITYAAPGQQKLNLVAFAKKAGLLDLEGTWGQMTHEIVEKLRVQTKKEYLTYGRQLLKDMKGGVCTMFTCGAIGWVAEHADLLPEDGVVELFAHIDKSPGHAFAVVGRDRTGDADKVDQWGDLCFVIDPWFARHRATSPGKDHVKDLVVNDPFYLAAYVQFLKEPKTRVAQLTFTKAELSTLL